MDPNKPIKPNSNPFLFQKAEGYFKLLETNPPFQKFKANCFSNLFFAYVTVPVQGLVVDRILFKLNNPSKNHSPYLERIKKLGMRGLFAGAIARSSYCLIGNFLTIEGNYIYGTDYKKGLVYTAATNQAHLYRQISFKESDDCRSFYDRSPSYYNSRVCFPFCVFSEPVPAEKKLISN